MEQFTVDIAPISSAFDAHRLPGFAARLLRPELSVPTGMASVIVTRIFNRLAPPCPAPHSIRPARLDATGHQFGKRRIAPA
jgi:hypothetical protein